MAITILALRPRETGTEIVLDDNGIDRTLWRKGWWPDKEADVSVQKAELVEWGTPHIQKLRTLEAEQAAEDAANETALDAQAFFTWLYSKRANRHVRDILKPLAEFYRDEVI